MGRHKKYLKYCLIVTVNVVIAMLLFAGAELFYDGIHLNELGHRLVTKELAKFLATHALLR